MFMNAKYFLHHDHDGQRAIGGFWPRVVRWHVLSWEGMEVSPAVMAPSVETMVEACGTQQVQNRFFQSWHSPYQ